MRNDIDPAVVTRLLFGMINSLVEWYDPAAGAGRTRAAPPLTPEALADAVVGLALDGLHG